MLSIRQYTKIQQEALLTFIDLDLLRNPCCKTFHSSRYARVTIW